MWLVSGIDKLSYSALFYHIYYKQLHKLYILFLLSHDDYLHITYILSLFCCYRLKLVLSSCLYYMTTGFWTVYHQSFLISYILLIL